jgi:ubiquinone/menaquinone biosynthesis C-methylase UbiE
MMDDKVHCMQTAGRYGVEYWDGERRYGYGGYRYIPGYWRPVAEALVDTYRLGPNARILDVGCGKGFLLYELSLLLPEAELAGIDCSDYALENAKPEMRNCLRHGRAQERYPCPDNYFDLVFSNTTLHNLEIEDLKKALVEIERVGKAAFVCVESYRNEQELFNVQCWALTCRSFFSVTEWRWLFSEFGYTGDYEFIFF